MILVFTGEGKGKTTAALGCAIRAKGRDKKVILIQFLKGSNTGEVLLIHKLNLFPIYRFGTENFFYPKSPDQKIVDLVKKGIKFALELISSREFDILILDELNIVFHLGIAEPEEFLKAVETLPKEKHIIITGRDAPESIIERADLVTEMREIKHYFTATGKTINGLDI
ncbi:cob(I)yrinic acid a,c-diamide adenosyltransferase [bacterium]|nr:cob(I)yrinic acid a,c-diamide adenosyltransferase [bacterium]